MSAFPARARKPYRGAAMEGSLARWYARQTKNLIATFASEAREIAAILPRGARVLEVAPGPGYLAVEIAKVGAFEIVGLDISESFVRIASDYATKSGVKVKFRQATRRRLHSRQNPSTSSSAAPHSRISAIPSARSRKCIAFCAEAGRP
jgi:protein-L-isoaspartate O-methyltransferase